MELADARSLSPETQQALRQRAVAAVVEQVRTQQQVARELGVARATVKRWVQRDRARGEPALDGGPRHAQLPSHLLLGSALLDYGGDGSLAQGLLGLGR